MKKIIINENQRGFLFKNGKYEKMLKAGKYRLWGTREIELCFVDQPVSCARCTLETLLADRPLIELVGTIDAKDDDYDDDDGDENRVKEIIRDEMLALDVIEEE